MKTNKITLVTALFIAQIGISQINTPSGVIQGNSGTSTNVGIGTASGVIPNAKLEILGTTNQLRLSNTTTLFTDINTSSAGHLVFQPGTTAGKIAFGIAAPATGVGFHSNMGVFRISDNASATRALQVSPNFAANGDIPAGVAILSPIATSGEGLSFLPAGGTTSGVKLGAYAYSSAGWKSMWETANVNSIGQLPNLLLAKSGGKVGIGLGAVAPAQALDVNGNFSLRGNNFIYNTTDGIINWGSGATGNLYFRTLTTQGVTTAYTDRMTILNNGNVGIGTTAPTAKLQVAGQIKIVDNTEGVGKVLTSDANGLATWQTLTGVLSGGNANYIPKWTSSNALSATSLIYDDGSNVGIGTTTPTERLQIGDRFVFHDGGNKYFGYNVRWSGTNSVRIGADFVSAITFGGGNINFVTDISGAANSITNPTSKLFIENTTGNVGIATSTPRAKLDVNGKVIIGTNTQTGTHSNAMLTVDGKMVAQSCYITIANWADYVFADDYKLPNLYEVEKYYKENKHLPEIPSEKEVIENGIDIAEMNKLLLKKIEEMTILMVNQQKQIDALNAKVK